MTVKSQWSRLGQLLAIAAISIVAGLSFSVALGARATLLPVVIGAMASLFLSSVLIERKAGFAMSALASLAGLFIAVLAFGRFNPMVVVDGFVNGWIRVLTTSIPSPAEPDILAVPLIVTWVAAFASAELALRTTSALGPVAPGVFAYTLGLMFGSGGSAAKQGILAALALLGASGALVMLRASYTVGGKTAGVPVNMTNRRLAAGFGIIAAFALIGTSIGTLLPLSSARDPFELRELVQEPPELRTALNPAAFAQKALNDRDDPDARAVFTVETDQAAEKARYRLLVLDSYDGQKWSSSAQFLRAGKTLPDPPELNVPTTAVRQKITVQGLGGYWLPTVDRPTRVQDDDLMFDRESGMLASRSGMARGRTFEIESQEPQLASDVNAPRTARFASGHDVQHYLELPPSFTATMRAAAADGASAAFQFQSAASLEKYLGEGRGLRTAPRDRPRSGQSLADLENLLTGSAGGIGSPDQFAALYAVLGRAAGMPTRLVVGYGVPPVAGRHEVRTNDLQVWPEVLFEGIGWVGFDPVPGGQAKPDQRAPENKPNLQDTLKKAASPPASPSDVGPTSTPSQVMSDDGGLANVLRIAALVVLAAFAGLVVWVAFLRIIRVARHRSRKKETDPRHQIVGAWEEALDLLSEHGLRDTRAMTASDVVRQGMYLIGPTAGQPLAALRTIVNQARYRHAEPNPNQVEQAWTLVAPLGHQWRRSLSSKDRLRLLVDPRPLLAKH